LLTMNWPSTSISRPLPKNMPTASLGLQTIGSRMPLKTC
jgi:hypothetical protein